MSRSFSWRHWRTIRYVQRKREEFGLAPVKPSCRGWRHHFHKEAEVLVARAPARLGYLIELWWGLHMRWCSHACAQEERARIEEAKREVQLEIEAQIEAFLKRPKMEGLALRSNGWFVRVMRERVW